MLTSAIIKKIENLVAQKPRSIQEISNLINKNWRTADRYIEVIKKDFGTLETRVFREGTRGALKIVYWAPIEKVNSSVFQEKLEEDISRSKKKEDFSAFNIFQYISDKNKKVTIEETDEKNLDKLKNYLLKTKKQLLIFSGNLSFINLRNKKVDLLKELEKLVKKNVSIKIVCRVDMAGKNNVEKLLSLNHKYGKELLEIRHTEQPLRAMVYDENIITLKEVKDPTGKANELKEKIFIYYELTDKDWIIWLKRIFWKMFNNSIDAKKRLKEIDKIL